MSKGTVHFKKPLDKIGCTSPHEIKPDINYQPSEVKTYTMTQEELDKYVTKKEKTPIGVGIFERRARNIRING